MKETKIYAMFNNKGGVGKTTATLMLAQLLAKKGSRVLLIDMDPQANLTSQFIDEEVQNNSTYELLLTDVTLQECIRTYSNKDITLDYVPSNAYLNKANIEIILNGMTVAPGTRLKNKMVDETINNYDHILIDTNPSLDMLITNTLTASNQVIVPMKADAFSVQGITILLETIKDIQMNYNNELSINSIFLNEYVRSNVYQKTYDLLKQIPEFRNVYISSAVAIKENTTLDGLYINNKLNKKIVNQYEELLLEMGL